MCRDTHICTQRNPFKNIKTEAMMSTQSICKVKRSSTTTLWDKEFTKVIWVWLVWVIYCWPWPWPEEEFSLSSFSYAICVSRGTCSQGLGLIALFAGTSASCCVDCHYYHSTFWVLTLIFTWPLSHCKPFIFWDHAMNAFFVRPCTSFRTVEVSNRDSVSLTHFSRH